MGRKPKIVYRDADGNIVKPPKSAIPQSRRDSRPKSSKDAAKAKPDLPTKKKKTKYKVCCQCHEKLAFYQFYSENNPFVSQDGKMNICRNCIRELSVDKEGKLDINRFQECLYLLNKPFIASVFKSAIKENEELMKKGKIVSDTTVIGEYFRVILTLKQYKYLDNQNNNWLTEKQKKEAEIALRAANLTHEIVQDRVYDSKYIFAINEVNKKQGKDFVVTPEMIEMFGEGLTNDEYKLMVGKYEKLKQSYTVKTAMHEEFLIDYVKFQVKKDLAVAQDDLDAVKKWSALATTAAQEAKLTPKQLTAADLQNGLSTFGEIFEAVEGAEDIIQTLPQYKQQPNDMVDFTIWAYVNYERKLNGMPLVSYDEIYDFYERQKEEYVREHGDPFGLFKNDPTSEPEMRETVKRFLTVDDMYNDEVDDEDFEDEEEFEEEDTNNKVGDD